ncbi:hypothetical protein [Nonomuraea typhae]|uniref:Uncharacterized protein n=1 Tax=Nonomuraea typhae TaxID=2603600 RepID=A0ABW7YQY7_9ACTN
MASHHASGPLASTPYEVAERLVAELALRGVRADLQPCFHGPAWVSVWAGLLIRCDTECYSWITGSDGAGPIYDDVPADDPVTAAARIAARLDELAVQDLAHGARPTQAAPFPNVTP